MKATLSTPYIVDIFFHHRCIVVRRVRSISCGRNHEMRTPSIDPLNYRSLFYMNSAELWITKWGEWVTPEQDVWVITPSHPREPRSSAEWMIQSTIQTLQQFIEFHICSIKNKIRVYEVPIRSICTHIFSWDKPKKFPAATQFIQPD